MKIKIIKTLLVAIFFVVSFFLWRSIDRAINVVDASVWIVPIIWASAWFVFAYVNTVCQKKEAYLNMMFAFSYGMSFIFVHELLHLVGFSLAFLIALWAKGRVKTDLLLNIRVSIWKSIRAGSGLFVIAMASIICSQYYLEVKNLDTEKLIPQFYVSSITGNLTSRFLVATNPGIRDIAEEDLSVDKFILQTQKGEVQSDKISSETDAQIEKIIEKNNPSATEAQKNIMKTDALRKMHLITVEIGKNQEDLLLLEGRRRFSEMAGRSIDGSEKMADVLAYIVNKKINQYFGAGAEGENKTAVLPYIMVIGLFITIVPIGSLLNALWIVIAEFFIWIFLKSDILSISKTSVEAEVLE